MTAANQRFLREVEHTIVTLNREVLSGVLGTITRARMSELAMSVARLRGAYLRSALDAQWSEDSPETAALRTQRESYEEALAAFDALERAVERGYVEVDAT